MSAALNFVFRLVDGGTSGGGGGTHTTPTSGGGTRLPSSQKQASSTPITGKSLVHASSAKGEDVQFYYSKRAEAKAREITSQAIRDQEAGVKNLIKYSKKFTDGVKAISEDVDKVQKAWLRKRLLTKEGIGSEENQAQIQRDRDRKSRHIMRGRAAARDKEEKKELAKEEKETQARTNRANRLRLERSKLTNKRNERHAKEREKEEKAEAKEEQAKTDRANRLRLERSRLTGKRNERHAKEAAKKSKEQQKEAASRTKIHKARASKIASVSRKRRSNADRRQARKDTEASRAAESLKQRYSKVARLSRRRRAAQQERTSRHDAWREYIRRGGTGVRSQRNGPGHWLYRFAMFKTPGWARPLLYPLMRGGGGGAPPIPAGGPPTEEFLQNSIMPGDLFRGILARGLNRGWATASGATAGIVTGLLSGKYIATKGMAATTGGVTGFVAGGLLRMSAPWAAGLAAMASFTSSAAGDAIIGTTFSGPGRFSPELITAKAMGSVEQILQDLRYSSELGEQMGRFQSEEERAMRAAKAMAYELFGIFEPLLTKFAGVAADRMEEIVRGLRARQGKEQTEDDRDGWLKWFIQHSHIPRNPAMPLQF